MIPQGLPLDISIVSVLAMAIGAVITFLGTVKGRLEEIQKSVRSVAPSKVSPEELQGILETAWVDDGTGVHAENKLINNITTARNSIRIKGGVNEHLYQLIRDFADQSKTSTNIIAPPTGREFRLPVVKLSKLTRVSVRVSEEIIAAKADSCYLIIDNRVVLTWSLSDHSLSSTARAEVLNYFELDFSESWNMSSPVEAA